MVSSFLQIIFFSLGYLFILLVPGFLIVAIYRTLYKDAVFKSFEYSYLLSISLSYVTAILLLFLFRIVEGTATELIGVYFLIVIVEALYLLYLNYKNKISFYNISHKKSMLSVLMLLLPILIYLFGTAPYLEIPSDAWWHLGEIQNMHQLARVDQLPVGGSISSALSQNGFWYYIAGLLISFFDYNYIDSIKTIGYVNNILFLLAVYSFSALVLEKSKGRESKINFTAIAATLFTLLHFGVSEFSFVRYYTYAPVMLNFILYSTTIILVFKYMQRDVWFDRYFLTIVLLIITMGLVHLQEVMLLSVIVITIIFYQFFINRISLTNNIGFKLGLWNDLYSTSNTKRSRSFYISLFLYLCIHIVAIVTIDRHYPFEVPDVIKYESILPFLDGFNMVLLSPQGKFYEVVTLWGVVVYALFVVRIRDFIGNPYLMSGMLLPIVTVFNPIFTDFFFRFSWGEVLYRICYAIPLATVGGYLFVINIQELFDSCTRWFRRVINVISIALLTATIFPINFLLIESPSRLVTLSEIEPKGDYRYLQDMISFLNKEDISYTVHTDRITGYIVNGMTKHQYNGFKFSGSGAISFKPGSDDYKTIYKNTGNLIIVNLRDGAWSKSGADSGHWSGDVTRMSQYYSIDFLSYLEKNKRSLFETIWEGDNIIVYKIID